MNIDDQQLNNSVDQSLDIQTSTDQDICEQQKNRRVQKWDKILNVLLILVIVALVGTVVAKAFFVSNVAISGESMFPTYTNAQVVTVNRVVSDENVKRGDIVVFYLEKPNWFAEHFDFLFPRESNPDDPHRLLIKRVIATQGDKIWVESVDEGHFQVIIQSPSGEKLYENYIFDGEQLSQNAFWISPNRLKGLENTTETDPYVVPKGTFFAMGDNREDSYDSRYFGSISYQNIFGIVNQ